MPRTENNSLSLKTYLDLSLTPMVSNLAEQAGTAFGLGPAEAMKLALACEEIYGYLCGLPGSAEAVEIRLHNGGWRTTADFALGTRAFDMRAFNLTTRTSLEDENSLEEMGLLLASRLVDGLRVIHGPGRDLILRMIKEKEYPAIAKADFAPPKLRGGFAYSAVDGDDLKILAGIIFQRYPSHLYPRAFGYPGKLVDMVAAGDFSAILALDDHRNIHGGLIWRRLENMVVCHGPYLAGPESDAAASGLTEAFINQVARSGAIGVINRHPTPQLPTGHFETLGEIAFEHADQPLRRPACYRLLGEDEGCSVWVHPELEPFLREAYQRLVLPRDIRPVRQQGETVPAHSVLGAEIRKETEEAVFRPIVFGEDAAANLAAHVKLMAREGIGNATFEMDLGHSWQALFTPALMQTGFKPALVIPYGGQADMVIWQGPGSDIHG